MGNALINELIIGIASKDTFSMDEPVNDSQFASFFLDPLLPRAINAATGGAVQVPNAPRNDLLPLVTYASVFCPNCTTPLPAGPIADLLRLNTGIPATPPGQQKRIGLLAGDNAGYPNGRRVFDDVTDISLRVVAGVLAGPPFNGSPNNLLGDGVNRNDRNDNNTNDPGGGNLDNRGYQNVFPYVGFAHSGRNSRHVDAFEPLLLAVSGSNCAISQAGTDVGMSGVAGIAITLLIPMVYVFGRRFTRKARRS